MLKPLLRCIMLNNIINVGSGQIFFNIPPKNQTRHEPTPHVQNKSKTINHRQTSLPGTISVII